MRNAEIRKSSENWTRTCWGSYLTQNFALNPIITFQILLLPLKSTIKRQTLDDFDLNRLFFHRSFDSNTPLQEEIKSSELAEASTSKPLSFAKVNPFYFTLSSSKEWIEHLLLTPPETLKCFNLSNQVSCPFTINKMHPHNHYDFYLLNFYVEKKPKIFSDAS